MTDDNETKQYDTGKFAMMFNVTDDSGNADMDNDGKDTLPIVLDGPFSKLGEENISLVANVLPQVSEQVIVFMLRKDWAYTGLDKYVGAEYSIDKKPDESFASIRKVDRA